LLPPMSDTLLPLPAGDSREQREAESLMLAALSAGLGVELSPRRIALPSGGRVEVDGVADDPPILCEAWAHQGPPKSAQKAKVLTDAFKLAFIARLGVLAGSPRLILLLSDDTAAASFVGKGWSADALRTFGIEVIVVKLPPEVRDRVAQAQRRQFR
jgi:hypothetical protein